MIAWLCRLLFWWKRPAALAPQPVASLTRLERIILTDGVARTLFEDYAEHRRSARGHEEIGWVLLGLRQGDEAIALAALPAGTSRDAGAAHVQFDAEAQGLASRIVRQRDKRLQILGVVHTHPGDLREPSDGDLHGDSRWVGALRGGEGVFAIGTADAHSNEAAGAHVQRLGDLCFCWYALGVGERRYRTLPVQVTLGPDLAQRIRTVWAVIESNTKALEYLCRLFAKVEFDILNDDPDNLLAVKISLAESGQQIRLLLSTAEARYYWERDGEVIAIDPREEDLVRAVFLILAELAKEDAQITETPTFVES
ncbi:MAG: Mov34/MPN/PAD-1 family protein [Planctomycetes bacterium]|nr:Mov34/MPN/PAD-1 family protein [Planctomycetota bacterium]